MLFLRWILVLAIGFCIGKLVSLIKLPGILGWLIAGMILGLHGINLLPQVLIDSSVYKIIISWMQCAFGIMLGSELIWKKIRSYGKALVLTTLSQSLGTFFVVSAVFMIVFIFTGQPAFLAIFFGSIALATAPAPVLSIVKEFKTKGPVTDTLIPMAVLDDIVGILVFFSVNAVVSSNLSNGAVPFYFIPVMILLPVAIGAFFGIFAGIILKHSRGKISALLVIIFGITITMLSGLFFNLHLNGIVLNYMLLGVAFSAAFANIIDEQRLSECLKIFNPILMISLLAAIIDLASPLDWHLIFGAGLFTFIYIASRAFGKYFGSRFGAKALKLPETVQNYLGFTLLPHSGVSLVFTGIACETLKSGGSEYASILQGTIAAAAVINEIIAVIAAKKGFQAAKEIPEKN